MSREKIDHVRVRRLINNYGWWFTSFYHRVPLCELLKHPPIETFVEDFERSDDRDWHFGRVRFFYDQIRTGKKISPIMVDNYCHNGHIYPEPVVIDGHHRLTAHYFARVLTVPCSYSGRVDLLDYLTGKRRTPPRY